MLECWHEIPSKRPSFAQLRNKFDHLLSARHCNAYIDLRIDELNDIYNVQDDEEPDVVVEPAITDKRSVSPSQGSVSSSINGSVALKVHLTNCTSALTYLLLGYQSMVAAGTIFFVSCSAPKVN